MSNDIVKSAGTALGGRIDDVDFQFGLFDRFKLARTLAETHRFVRNEGDEGHPYKLVKRERPVRIFDDGGGARAVAQMQRSYSDRVGVSRPARRGKYNDEERLALSEALSVEPKEVDAWASI